MKMIVEIPKGNINKYEYDIITGKIELDRVLAGAMFYPEEYGFIPETLDYDGDPLDVICLTNYPTFPGCHLPIRIIGVLKMIDGGEEDDKLIAVNAVDPRLKELEKLPATKAQEIENFFSRYKELEKKEVAIKGWGSQKEAQMVLEKCQKLYKKCLKFIKMGMDKKELVKIINSHDGRTIARARISRTKTRVKR